MIALAPDLPPAVSSLSGNALGGNYKLLACKAVFRHSTIEN